MPTLLVWGDADSLVGRDMQALLSRRGPYATLFVYPGGRAHAAVAGPARFAAEVSTFVNRVRS
jgi:pimeloyl-ACP methyl ester carboxylesterase